MCVHVLLAPPSVLCVWSTALVLWLPCIIIVIGGPSNMVLFRDVSQGLHTFSIVAEDLDGLVDKCDVHFEGSYRKLS